MKNGFVQKMKISASRFFLAIAVLFGSTAVSWSAEVNPSIAISVTSMKDDVDYAKRSLCKLKFSITNNAFGTIHRISAGLTGYDDRGEKLGELLSANASNRKGFSMLPIAKGSTVKGVGDASFKVNCKYLAKLKYDGIDEDDCAMRMLPENVSCSKITTLRSEVPTIKVQN